MPKPTIFLSHITEEADLVSAFRREIEARFLGLVEVFQSSDSGSMPIGTNWLDNITRALRGCQAILLFCSPNSVKRPWINFECGAGWAREIEVVPICHSGLRPVDLPIPISLLQGVEASNGPKIQLVFEMIAAKLGSVTPQIDQIALTNHVDQFSSLYVKRLDVDTNVKVMVEQLDKNIVSILKRIPANQVCPITDFPQPYFERIKGALDTLQKNGNVQYSWQITGMILDDSPYSGTRGVLTLNISQALYDGLQEA